VAEPPGEPLADGLGDAVVDPEGEALADFDAWDVAEALAVALVAAVGAGDGERSAMGGGATVGVGESARAVVPSASDPAISTPVAAARIAKCGAARDDTGGSRFGHVPSSGVTPARHASQPTAECGGSSASVPRGH
jgi:hypothetical protein